MSSPLPQHCPSPRELDDLELIVSGAADPINAFNAPSSPLTLHLPDELAGHAALELVDPEGLPLARLDESEGAWVVTPLSRPSFGPFRRLYLTPGEVRETYAGRTFLPVSGPITDQQLDLLTTTGPSVLLVLVGAGTPTLSPVATLRAASRVARALGDCDVVAVPLARHTDASADDHLRDAVVKRYAATDPVVELPAGGEPLPDLRDIVTADQPPPAEQGLVLFFTGLSGSGKSTLAQALMDRILEAGARTVTSLDGDVVRRHLSAGLTFSKADRETNIRRIGWVAAEISRHGGVAVCSPIAPFDETRQQVRTMVDDAGGAFFLVHVATPLEECERRDRKGLYAKARRGEIPEFTGISSPYEEPADADVKVDTTGRTIDDALDDVIDELAARGYLDLRGASAPEPTPKRAAEPAGLDSREPSGARAASAGERPSRPGDPPLNVLFVCTANICRSPFMELRARSLTEGTDGSSMVFSSAGTHGFRDHPMDETMAATLVPRAVESEHFRSRPLTYEMVHEADLVITAEAAHRSFILDDQPHAFRKVFTLGQLAEAIQRVASDLGARELLSEVGEHRGTAASSLDVGDPYRRGPAAAQACADHIEALLRVVIPALAGSGRI